MKKVLTLLFALVMIFSLASSVTAAEKAQGVFDDKIIIGTTMPLSGQMASVGVPFTAGIQAYFDYVNAQGGIDGRQIEFLTIDNEYDPVKAKSAVEKLVEDQHIFALVSPFSTPIVGAILPDVKEYGIPLVFPATGISQLYSEAATTNEEGRNVFPVQPLYNVEGQLMIARAAGTFGASKVGIIYTNDDAGKNILEGAQKQADAIGIELVAEQVAVGAADASPAIISILGQNVDVVIAAAMQPTFPTIVKELATQGNTNIVIGSCVNSAITIAEQIADVIEGQFDVYISTWKRVDEELYPEQSALFKEYIPQEYLGNADAESGWMGGYMVCTGLNRLVGQELTWDSFIEAMESEPIDVPFSATIDYSNGRRLGVDSMLLSKCNMDDPSGTGWEVVYPTASISELIGE